MDEQRWRERAGSFGAAADVYDRSRPSYPVEAVRWALPEGAHRVLDLGAGTGKLTEVLLDLGMDVVAVEPSEQMRERIPPRAEVLEGTAEALPLKDGSVDAVLVGQAFHWFDREQALAEMARVLRPGGTVGLLWNVMDDSVEWVRQVTALFGAEDLVSHMDGRPPFTGHASFGDPTHDEFENSHSLDRDLLVDLVATRAVLTSLPEEERLQLLGQVREAAPEEEPFELPYVTDAWRAVRT
jgi:SAM-dependent methyltransferase